MHFKTTILSLLMLLFISQLNGQIQVQPNELENEICSFEKIMGDYYNQNPKALKEANAFEKKVEAYMKLKKEGKLKAATSWVVPVVFHIYGNDWDGKTPVTDSLVKESLKNINADFKGFNDAVDPAFANLEGGMNIEFKLAQLDPDGNTTTGIIYHETKEGFGLSGTNDEEIAKYAWDNFKYFNVHIQLIIKSGSKTNSGIAWFPDSTMSVKGTARVVYNGKYIIYSPPASSLTHEFGHYLGLHHTFNGGCVSTGGDLVDDTPPCTAGQGCDAGTKNCFGNNINSQNHMDYNPCESMFTKGQVTRMESFMEHSARKTLWTDANLIATGVKNDLGKRILFTYQQPDDPVLDKYLTLIEGPNNDGSISNKRKIKAIEGVQFTVTSGNLTQGTHFTTSGVPAGLTTRIKVLDATTAEIYFDGNATQHTNAASTEFTVTLLNAAVSGGVSQLHSATGKYKIEFLNPYDKFYEVLSPHVMMGITSQNRFATKTSFTSPAVGNTLFLNLMNWDGNTLSLDNYNYNMEVLCNSGTKNVTLLAEGTTINATGTWVAKPEVATVPPIVTGPDYTTWNGKTGYAGIRIPTIMGTYIYGWVKIDVAADGKLGTIIAYGVNEKPGDAMVASINKPMVMYLDDRFLENALNNGELTNKLNLELVNTTFATTGTLTAGTHYNVSNVPANMQLVVNATSSTKAVLSLTGATPNHSWGYLENIKLEFLDAAFASHSASQVIQSTYNLCAEFLGETFSKTSTAKFSRADANGSTGWVAFVSGNDVLEKSSIGHQMQLYDNGDFPGVKFISWRKDAVANSNYELTPISANTVIGPNSSWKNGREYHAGRGQHMIDSDTYTSWRGTTRYVGVRFQISGRMHYGWLELRVSSAGQTFEFLSYGMNCTPEKGILAGTTTSAGGSSNDTQKPTVPSNIQVTAKTASTVTLSWNASSDNVGVLGYTINNSTDNKNYQTSYNTYKVTDLETNKNYTFYLNAFDEAGNTSNWSSAVSVKTNDVPTAPTNISATGATASTISLAWDAVPNAVSYTVNMTDGNVYSETSTNSFTATGLSANKEYTFFIKAEDAEGNQSAWSSSFKASTNGSTDMQVPTAPTNLSSSNITDNGVTLNWTASTDNVGVTGYDIFNGSTDIGDATSTNFSVTGLSAGTAYIFTVKAKDAAGNISSASNAVSITTTGGAVTYCGASATNGPEYISNVAFGTINNSSARVGYEDYTNISTNVTKGSSYTLTVTIGSVYNGDKATAWFDWNGDGDFADTGEKFALTVSGSTATSGISIPSSASASITRMRVRVYYNTASDDPCGTKSYGEVEDYTINLSGGEGDNQAPTAPTNLSSSNITQTGVTLSWTASTDNVGVTAYDIFQGATDIGDATGTSFNVTGLTANTTYNFTVKAKDAAGNISTASNAVSVTTTSASDTQAPTVPTNVTVTGTTTTTISLSWTAAMDNIGVVSYTVNNATDNTNVTVTGTNHTVTGLTANKSYTFYINAKDAAGNTSGWSTSAQGTTTGTTVSYCAAGATNGPEHISNVSFGSINNSSSRDSYHDYTNLSTTVNKGSSYILTVTIGSVYNGDKVTSWFDWNGDGDFEDTGEKFILTVSGSTATSSITIPTSATATNTRMRIRVHYYAAAADKPCGTEQYGEVEDYTININSSVSGASHSEENFDIVKTDFKVFPNPSSGQFNAKINSDYIGEVTVKVLNILGKVVSEKQIEKSNKEIDIQMNIDKPGTFLIQFVLGNNVVNTTIIIK